MKYWRVGCDDCDWIGESHDLLVAPNPFDPDHTDEIHGCPKCKTVEALVRLCDAPGCRLAGSCGTPCPEGHYVTTCGNHRPELKG